jgi:hypothetical protein
MTSTASQTPSAYRVGLVSSAAAILGGKSGLKILPAGTSPSTQL